MKVYQIPFSITPGASGKTLVTCTAANKSIEIDEIVLTDELALSTDKAAQFAINKGTSITSAGSGTTVTPTPLNGAPACSFTAKNNYSGEPTLGSPVVHHNATPFAAGTTFYYPWGDNSRPIASGTEALQVVITAPGGTRAQPITGFINVIERA